MSPCPSPGGLGELKKSQSSRGASSQSKERVRHHQQYRLGHSWAAMAAARLRSSGDGVTARTSLPLVRAVGLCPPFSLMAVGAPGGAAAGPSLDVRRTSSRREPGAGSALVVGFAL